VDPAASARKGASTSRAARAIETAPADLVCFFSLPLHPFPLFLFIVLSLWFALLLWFFAIRRFSFLNPGIPARI
jgi:hypothetical protein